jgi:hypothetical protein
MMPTRLAARRTEGSRHPRLHPCPQWTKPPGHSQPKALQKGCRIENAFARLKDWRGIAMRYTRCGDLFLSAIALAAAVILWLPL